jgi:sulfoxide reductase heme-binding subunit YedZ
MTFSLNGPGLWYATRATGLVTLLLLTTSVFLGILTAGRFASTKWPRFLTMGLHRNISLVVLIFLALHIGTTVIDTYTSIPLTAAFLPFVSSYKGGWWLSMGAVAVDLLIALVVTSLVRLRIGHRAWRRLHWAAYLCWPLALVHGLGIGTDTTSTAVFVFTLFCVASVAAVATWRLITARMRAA